jgi:uncharacterized membrane protein
LQRGEWGFLIGMLLMLVAPWIGGGVGNLLCPATVVLSIIGILFILGAAFDIPSHD